MASRSAGGTRRRWPVAPFAMPATGAMPELRAWRVGDRDAWNAFVESAPYRPFPQLGEWGELREPFGWVPLRVAVGDDPGRPAVAVGQVLLRRVPVLGWRL